MAILSDTARKRIWARIIRAVSEEREPVALTKTELRAAVEAVDDWVDDNAGAYNAALPTAARTGSVGNFAPSTLSSRTSEIVGRRD